MIPTPPRRSSPVAVVALTVGLLLFAGFFGVAVWQGVALLTERGVPQVSADSYDGSDTGRDDAMTAAKRAAVDLTTINWQTADEDVQKILDNSTGTFHDDFDDRMGPFVDLVRQQHSVSVGTVNATGVERIEDQTASVIVAVSVSTTNAGTPAAQPKQWRMRIGLERVDGRFLPSKVEFVP